jgi:transposase
MRKCGLHAWLNAEQRNAELETELAGAHARIAELEACVAALTQQIRELSEKLNQNSSNSHRPPSSDSPSARKARKTKDKSRGRRKRGGQPGHKGHHRALVALAQVDKVVDLYPAQCESCWQELPETADPQAKRYQVTELPPVQPHTTELRRHAVQCSGCGYRTRAAYDKTKIPDSPVGPRLMALISLLTGVYHLSRRKAVSLLGDVVGVQLSLGAVSAVEARVSEAVAPAVAQAWAEVEQSAVKHTDGTSWVTAGATRVLWTIATRAATVFKILLDGKRQTLQPLYGILSGILVSDRAKVLLFWRMERRQVCWAHLLRGFVAFAEREGAAGTLGRELLDYTGILFEYWHRYKSGTLSREQLQERMTPLRKQVEAVLERGVAADIERVSGSCADILVHRSALWTFLERDGVEPTNNHAERELRAFVLWRKRSFGTQSERGNLFAERMMTVAHTARKQGVHVLSFLSDCCQAKLSATSAPLLLMALGAAV